MFITGPIRAKEAKKKKKEEELLIAKFYKALTY